MTKKKRTIKTPPKPRPPPRELRDICDTCSDKEVCGSNSSELISPEDLEKLENMGIKAKAVVYACESWNQHKKD